MNAIVVRGPQTRMLAQLALLAVTAIWGLTFVLVQDAVSRTPVMSFLGERFVLAAVLVAVGARRALRGLSLAGWLAGAAMGLCLTAGYILQTYGLIHTSAAHSGFITGLFVVFTPLLGALVLRRCPSRVSILGALISLIGLALLAGVGGPVHALGDGLTVGCAVAFAVHILVTDAAASEHSTSALLAVQLGCCGLICTAIGAAQGQLSSPPDATVWVALLITSVLASALAYFVQTTAQRHTSPERTALILAGEPAFAGLFAYLLKHERLAGTGWLGAGLILAAIMLVELVPRRRIAPRPTPEGPAAPELDTGACPRRGTSISGR